MPNTSLDQFLIFKSVGRVAKGWRSRCWGTHAVQSLPGHNSLGTGGTGASGWGHSKDSIGAASHGQRQSLGKYRSHIPPAGFDWKQVHSSSDCTGHHWYVLPVGAHILIAWSPELTSYRWQTLRLYASLTPGGWRYCSTGILHLVPRQAINSLGRASLTDYLVLHIPATGSCQVLSVFQSVTRVSLSLAFGLSCMTSDR